MPKCLIHRGLAVTHFNVKELPYLIDAGRCAFQHLFHEMQFHLFFLADHISGILEPFGMYISVQFPEFGV